MQEKRRFKLVWKAWVTANVPTTQVIMPRRHKLSRRESDEKDLKRKLLASTYKP